MRLPLLAAAAAFLSCLAGCGGEKGGTKDGGGPEPAGERVSGWTQPSSDPGLASIQKYVRRKVEAAEGEPGRIDVKKEGWRRGPFPLRPVATFEPKRTYLWRLVTSEGSLLFSLRAESAPEHVSNLAYLTLLGFFDESPFESIVRGKGATAGERNPGYTLTGPELSPSAKHDKRGLLSAVSFGPGTDGARFRVTFAADPALDEHETVMGELLEGSATLDKIEALGTESGAPKKPVTIRSAALYVR
jgi:cyclophilin family peptidyl-prolyl cis-trans isomerase